MDQQIIEKYPTRNFRYYTPNKEFVGAVLEQEFIVTFSDGSGGKLWMHPLPHVREREKQFVSQTL